MPALPAVAVERIRGRNPKGKSLTTKGFKEGKAIFSRAIMRMLVRLIKKDEDTAKSLTRLLVQHGYPKNSFKIIQHSAMGSKTMFHNAIREQLVYECAEERLSAIFQNIRYKYSKSCMEKFF